MQSVHVKQFSFQFFAEFSKCQEQTLMEMQMQMPEPILKVECRGIFHCIAKVQISSSRENKKNKKEKFTFLKQFFFQCN